MTTEPAYRVEEIGGQFHMVVSMRGQEERYPAASKIGAEMMVSLEKHRVGGTGPYAGK